MKGTRTSIDVGGVLQTGRQLSLREDISLPEFGFFQFPAPIEVTLAIRRVGGGLELKGTIEAEVRGECARCLDEVHFPLHLDIDERFEAGTKREDPFADSNVLAGDELDLSDLARQLIDSALPLVLLCDDGCKGLCAHCGHKQDGSCCCTYQE